MAEQQQQKSMLITMVLFLVVLMAFWQVAAKVTPLTTEFFKSQTWLTSIISSYPLIAMIIFALITSFYTNLFYKFGISKEVLEKMISSKKEQKELRLKIKENKDNPQKMAELQKEMMSGSFQNLSVSMGNMFSTKFIFFVTLPSLIYLFMLIGPLYNAANVGYIVNWGFSIFGRTGAGWLLTLIFLTVILASITKKLLKLDF